MSNNLHAWSKFRVSQEPTVATIQHSRLTENLFKVEMTREQQELERELGEVWDTDDGA